MSETLLKVSGLTMRFGGLLAVDQVEFDVRRDEVFAIIGPNGAGKTTGRIGSRRFGRGLFNRLARALCRQPVY